MVTDLDAQLTRIRDYRTRTYFADAVKCFRAGAYRAAVAATWVTVAYDLIAKYRELSALGDAEAHRFIGAWDRARAQNHTARLLQLERDLLAHAHNPMAIIDAMTLRALNRLVEDRHLCAHPTFATQDDLYEPPSDLVRAHMSIAVDELLSQQPIRGRGIFETFRIDIQSAGFPSQAELVADYVEQKYLRNMRPNVVRNFGIVLAKSVVRNVPPEWSNVRAKVFLSLSAVQLRMAAAWPDVESEIVRLIENDDPGSRTRAIVTLGRFPHLAGRIAHPTLIALQQTCSDPDAVRISPEVFVAGHVPEFRDHLVQRFEAFEDGDAAAILTIEPSSTLWPSSLNRFGRARGFREAESRFDNFIVPFQLILRIDHLNALLVAIQSSQQIWDAGGIPFRLANLLGVVLPHCPSFEAITNLYQAINPRTRASYTNVWMLMEQQGWRRPDLQQAENNNIFVRPT